MIILGLNLLHADSSAAIVVDGVLLAAAAEERFNRRKHYGGFPTSAIRFCLDHVGARIEDVDHVAIGRDTGANLERKIRYALAHPGEILNFLKIRAKGAKSANLRTLFSAELDLDPKRLSFEEHHVEHHLAHIASAYLVSDATHAAGFSFDGSGDFVTAMMAECTEDRIEAKRRTFVPHSLGWLYTTICQVLGYGKYGDEGKVMGLAACGSDEFRELLEEMAPIDSEGFRLNPEYFRPFGHDGGLQITSEGEVSLGRHYSDKLIERVGPPRERHGEIGARERDLACSLQNRFEEVFLHLLRILEKEVPSRDLAMAGGCALNSVANGKIFDHTGFQRTHIQPAAGDEGLAVGAALYVWCCKLGKPRRYVLRDARLGPEFDESTIRAALDAAGLEASRLEGDELLDSVAERLAAGDIVGWFQGRMEWDLAPWGRARSSRIRDSRG